MDEIKFFIAQGLGVVAVILGFINYQVKTREQVLAVHLSTTVCFALHYLLLGAWTGLALNIVGMVRNLTFYITGKTGKVPRAAAICFSALMGAVGIATGLIANEGWYIVLMVASLVINSYAMSFSNPNNIRKSILITSPLALAYNAFVMSAGGMVYEAVAIVSSAIGIFRYRKKA